MRGIVKGGFLAEEWVRFVKSWRLSAVAARTHSNAGDQIIPLLALPPAAAPPPSLRSALARLTSELERSEAALGTEDAAWRQMDLADRIGRAVAQKKWQYFKVKRMNEGAHTHGKETAFPTRLGTKAENIEVARDFIGTRTQACIL